MAHNSHEDPPWDPPEMQAAREQMVQRQLAARDITNPRVLDAMRRIPRHVFVAAQQADEAYQDHPVPIGYGQTISQPYIVALMTQLLQPLATQRVLEIGTGCGYQTAVLSVLVEHVTTIEIVPELASTARRRLQRLGYDNVHCLEADGYSGCLAEAPFDAVLLTAAPPQIPTPLIEQLAVGGRLVAPVGDIRQNLIVLSKDAAGSLRESLVAPVRFVPMTGLAQESEHD